MTYFFAGKPSLEQIALNLDDVPNKIVAIRSKPSEEIANKILYRYKDDNALMWKGDFKFKKMGLDAEKVYYVLDNTNGKLQYIEVSKEIYDNFNKNVLPYKGKSKDYAKEIANKYQKDLVEKATKSRVISTDKIMNRTFADFARVTGLDDTRLNKISKVLDANQAFDSLDETTAKKVKDVILEDHKLGKIDLSKITNKELNNIIKNKTVKNYVDNIQYYSAKGISIEEFLQKSGINIIDNKTRLSVAESLGDSKLYMLECAENILNNGNLSDSQRRNLDNLLTAYGNESIGNLDISDMLTNLQHYLSKEQIQTVIDLAQSGVSDKLASSYTAEQLASVFNYTYCGGFEINSWLNDINLPKSSVKARDTYDSVSKIQDAISGHKRNKTFTSKQGDILDCLDSVISSANYDDAIVTYRGIKELYDRNVKIDVQNLKIGDSFESSGYQSSSVLLENCYGMKHDDTNIILKVIVPPNSGTGAYIENITGVTKYGQMEMLIKRDAKMTVVGDLEFKNVNGIMKTIVPVIVE